MTSKVTQDPNCDSQEQLDPSSHPDQVPGCFGCIQRRLHLLPIISVTWLSIALVMTYIIATVSGNVAPDFPYISYTARMDPERCIFSQFVNIGAVMLCSNGIIQYLYIKKIIALCKITERRRLYHKNFAGLVLITISSLGLSMVGNFPTSVEKVPHYLGAFLAFAFGVSYCWLQTSMSWKFQSCQVQGRSSKRIVKLQTIISLMATVFIFIFGITSIIYRVKRGPNDTNGGTGSLRAVYLVSTITEWLLALSYSVFILTFIPTFAKIKLKTASVEFETTTTLTSSAQNLADLESKAQSPADDG